MLSKLPDLPIASMPTGPGAVPKAAAATADFSEVLRDFGGEQSLSIAPKPVLPEEVPALSPSLKTPDMPLASEVESGKPLPEEGKSPPPALPVQQEASLLKDEPQSRNERPVRGQAVGLPTPAEGLPGGAADDRVSRLKSNPIHDPKRVVGHQPARVEPEVEAELHSPRSNILAESPDGIARTVAQSGVVPNPVLSAEPNAHPSVHHAAHSSPPLKPSRAKANERDAMQGKIEIKAAKALPLASQIVLPGTPSKPSQPDAQDLQTGDLEQRIADLPDPKSKARLPIEPRPLSGAAPEPASAQVTSASNPNTASAPTANLLAPAPPVAVNIAAEPLQHSAFESRSEVKVAPQIEAAIDQLTNARESGRSARPELTVRHQEFGAITMRIEASGADLRATLASRDPGFVPAIQAALAERAIAPSPENAAAQSQRGQDQSRDSSGHSQGSSQGTSQGFSGGSGGPSDQRYGSSTGSGQGLPSPYRDKTEVSEEGHDAHDHSEGQTLHYDDRDSNGLFA